MSAIQKATAANVHLKTELPGPKARAMIARDADVTSPSYPRSFHPMIPIRLKCVETNPIVRPNPFTLPFRSVRKFTATSAGE